MSVVQFTVLGRPMPAGSKRAFAIRKGGVPTGRVAVVDANPAQKSWQQEVASAALEAVSATHELLVGPLSLSVVFVVARPKGHYGTGRNAAVIKPSAPAWPAQKPDVSKLVRAVEDALTGVVYRDDAQIVLQHATKQYGTPQRAEVTISRLPGVMLPSELRRAA